MLELKWGKDIAYISHAPIGKECIHIHKRYSIECIHIDNLQAVFPIRCKI